MPNNKLVKRKPQGIRSGVKKSIEKLGESNKELKNIMRVLSDRQRRIFTAMAMGLNPLEAAIESREYGIFTGITKTVYMKPSKEGDDPKPILTSELTDRRLLDYLDPASYERLLNICTAYVKQMMSGVDPKEYIVDVREVFKLIAPEMMEVVAQIAKDKGAKDSDRIRAATALMDRAGYTGPESVKAGNVMMPVQVNIRFDKEAQPEFVPQIDHGNTD